MQISPSLYHCTKVTSNFLLHSECKKSFSDNVRFFRIQKEKVYFKTFKFKYINKHIPTTQTSCWKSPGVHCIYNPGLYKTIFKENFLKAKAEKSCFRQEWEVNANTLFQAVAWFFFSAVLQHSPYFNPHFVVLSLIESPSSLKMLGQENQDNCNTWSFPYHHLNTNRIAER